MERSRSWRRIGLGLGLLAALFGIYQLQELLGSLGRLPGPASREPVAHAQAEALAITADGRELLSADSQGRIQHWDLATGARRAETQSGAVFPVFQVFLDPRGHWGAFIGPSGVSLCRAEDGSATWKPPGVSWGGPSTNARFIFGFQGQSFVVLEAATRRVLRRIRRPGAVGGGCWDIDAEAKWLAWADPAGAHIISLTGGGRHQLLRGRWAGVPWIEFSPDGRWVGLQYRVGANRAFRSWSVGDWAQQSAFPTGRGEPLFHIDPSGQRVAMGAGAFRDFLGTGLGVRRQREQVSVPQVFDLKSGAALLDFSRPERVRGHADPIHDLVWSPNARVLASIDQSGRIGIWDLPTSSLRRFLLSAQR
jgi:WD40 repeat protein